MTMDVSGNYGKELPKIVHNAEIYLSEVQENGCGKSNMCTLCPSNGKYHGEPGKCISSVRYPGLPRRDFIIKFYHRYYGGVDNYES